MLLFNPGVVHDDIQPAVLTDRRLHEIRSALRNAYVGSHDARRTTRGLYLLRERARRSGVAVVIDDDSRSLLRQRHANRFTDPGIAAGDDRDLTPQAQPGFLRDFRLFDSYAQRREQILHRNSRSAGIRIRTLHKASKRAIPVATRHFSPSCRSGARAIPADPGQTSTR